MCTNTLHYGVGVHYTLFSWQSSNFVVLNCGNYNFVSCFAGTCSIVSASISYADSSTIQLEWVPEPSTASLVTAYDVCTTQGSDLTCATTTTTNYVFVHNLESGETMLVQVRAYTSGGPGQFYNMSVAPFPTISIHLATIVGGASLSAGVILGALNLALSICLCRSFCGWIKRKKKG